jgi:tetratricopeptide (TPR) repeat protein
MMWRMRAYALLSLVLLTFVGLAGAEEKPPSTDIELAKAHFNTGQIYYERGRFADAAHEFEEAYRLSNRAELLYNMGKSYDGSSDAARALGAYRRFLANVKGSPDQPWVEGRVQQLDKIVGRLDITSTVAGSMVKLDGAELGLTPLAEPTLVNPGGHDIEVAREGFATWRTKVVASPGQLTQVAADPKSMVKIVRVEVERKSTPIYKKWWLWTAVAVVVVAAAGATAGVLASKDDGVSGPHAQLPAVKAP